jgi:hypothetical protein
MYEIGSFGGVSIPNDRHRKRSTRRGELHPRDRRREGSLGLCAGRVVSIGDQIGKRLTPATETLRPRINNPVDSAAAGRSQEPKVRCGLP